MQFDVKQAIVYYLAGEKVRRTVWTKGKYVHLTDNGKQVAYEGKNAENEIMISDHYSPLCSIDKFGYNKDKKWEIL